MLGNKGNWIFVAIVFVGIIFLITMALYFLRASQKTRPELAELEKTHYHKRPVLDRRIGFHKVIWLRLILGSIARSERAKLFFNVNLYLGKKEKFIAVLIAKRGVFYIKGFARGNIEKVTAENFSTKFKIVDYPQSLDETETIQKLGYSTSDLAQNAGLKNFYGILLDNDLHSSFVAETHSSQIFLLSAKKLREFVKCKLKLDDSSADFNNLLQIKAFQKQQKPL